MTKLLDGPAMAKTLPLRRAARFLRVVIDPKGKVDALDMLEDEPAPEETIHAYECVKQSGWMHIRASGGRGGMYPVVEYKLCAEQPTDEEMRDKAKWRAWTCREGSKRGLAK